MYKVLWIILHTFFGVLTTVVAVLTSVKFYLANCFRPEAPIEEDSHMIEQSKTDLTKIPKHIVIIFNDSPLELNPLSKLITWIILTGVRYVSFYDYRGRFQDIHPDTWKRMEQIRSEYIATYSSKVTFHYVDSLVNTSLISAACRNACKSGIRPGDIDINYLNTQIEQLLPDFPDPDMAIHFDEQCCTYGLSPWHIRLTEFVQVQPNANLKLETYLNVLYKYSNCEQRFGK